MTSSHTSAMGIKGRIILFLLFIRVLYYRLLAIQGPCISRYWHWNCPFCSLQHSRLTQWTPLARQRAAAQESIHDEKLATRSGRAVPAYPPEYGSLPGTCCPSRASPTANDAPPLTSNSTTFFFWLAALASSTASAPSSAYQDWSCSLS